MSNRVIFLDIDGVLNSGRWYYERGGYVPRDADMSAELDPSAIQCLNRIIDQTGAKVCISSSWRILEDECEANIAEMLAKRGFVGEVIGRTPIYRGKCPEMTRRGLEIQAWIEASSPFDSICILDDSSDMAHLMPWLVQTTWAHGLTDEHVPCAVRMLTERSWP